MRLGVLLFVVIAIAGAIWFGMAGALAPTVAEETLYSGTGETNLDLNSDDNVLMLDTKHGQVVIQLRPDLAPIHVQRIKELVRSGFYDGLTFHRVIEGFMAQGGDPDGKGTGGSGLNLPAEFTDTKFKRGIVGMARSRDINSADSQFFIMLGTAPHLNGKYAVWGEVTDGMDVVDAIKKGNKNANGQISGAPDKIKRMHIKADGS